MSLNEVIGSAMGNAAQGAALGHAIEKLQDEADEANIRAMEAEAQNEQLTALLIKQGIDIPRSPKVERNRQDTIYLTYAQLKFIVIVTVVLITGVLVTTYIYNYIQEAARNTITKKRDAVLRGWGEGFWGATATCTQYGKVDFSVHVALDAEFDKVGNLTSSRPTSITYSIFFTPYTGPKIRPIILSGPLAEDGRFSIHKFGEASISGLYNFKTKRHELQIPGCPLIKPTTRN